MIFLNLVKHILSIIAFYYCYVIVTTEHVEPPFHHESPSHEEKLSTEKTIQNLEQKVKRITEQNKTCHDGMDSLFKRIEKCEVELEETTAASKRYETLLQECNKKNSALNEHSSEALASCHREVSTVKNQLFASEDKVKALDEKLKSASAELRLKEQGFSNDLQKLHNMIQKTEIQRKEIVATSEQRLNTIHTLQQKLSQLVKPSNNDSEETLLIFSLAQLKQASWKFLRINTILGKHLIKEILPLIPPSGRSKLENQLSSGYNYIKTIYESEISPKIEKTQIVSRLAYVQYVHPALRIISTKAMQFNIYRHWTHMIDVGNNWIDLHILRSLYTETPNIETLIPQNPLDRVIALIYILIIYFFSFKIILFIFCPVMKLIRYTLLCPFRLFSLLIGKMRKRGGTNFFRHQRMVGTSHEDRTKQPEQQATGHRKQQGFSGGKKNR